MSLSLGKGEKIALVGENGAGKSTLMNVLYGLYQPDAGEILIDGQRRTLRNPRDAMEAGIGMVHQHFMLVPTLSVAENVVLGREPRRLGLLDRQDAVRQVAQTARRFGFQLDPLARVRDLSVGSQQKVEIVKALHRGAKTLILDEPTAVLTPQEADDLFRVADGLARQGHTVIFIGHKLREVIGFADRILVMRRGHLVGEVPGAQARPGQLTQMMMGTADGGHNGNGGQATFPRESPQELSGKSSLSPISALAVEGLSAPGQRPASALKGICLQVSPGEIVGIAGVDGNGQTELAEVLTGLRHWTQGAFKLMGQPLTRSDPARVRALGVTHIPEDRHRRAIVSALTVEENLSLGSQRRPPFARGPWIDRPGRRAAAQSTVTRYDVRPPDPEAVMGGLSGGNQQKLVVARELGPDPRLVVAVQPTRGLDVGAVAAIHDRLRAARDRGAGVLLLSLDLDEVLALSDRLYVLSGGRITLELPRERFDERVVGAAMLGGGHG